MSDESSSPIEPFRPLPDRSWRERVDDLAERLAGLGRRARVAAAVVGAACVAVVAVVLLRPAGADSAPEAALPRASDVSSSVGATPSSVAPVLVVQAAGAVVHPGLYRLAAGARVDDLVNAAGGLAADADPDRINLAAPLTDGEKVYVPRAGEPVPADVAAGARSAPATEPVDLNTASVTDLDALPGIGPSTAQAIVDYRAQHGRFRSVDDLLRVRGIGAAKLDQIRPLVRV